MDNTAFTVVKEGQGLRVLEQLLEHYSEENLTRADLETLRGIVGKIESMPANARLVAGEILTELYG